MARISCAIVSLLRFGHIPVTMFLTSALPRIRQGASAIKIDHVSIDYAGLKKMGESTENTTVVHAQARDEERHFDRP